VLSAKKALPGRTSVAVTGEAGLGYMLGNLGIQAQAKRGHCPSPRSRAVLLDLASGADHVRHIHLVGPSTWV